MRVVRSLLWKDLRLARGYLIAGAAVWIVPYAYLAYVWLRTPDPDPHRIVDPSDWFMQVQLTGIFGGVGAMVIVALVAGASFATERTDRSGEFLAYLPLTRGARLLSKLAMVAGPALLLAATNPLIGLAAVADGSPQAPVSDASVIVTLLCSGLLVFGVAWLGSTKVSAAAALLLGLLSPFFVVCLYYLSVQTAEMAFGLEIDLDRWLSLVYRGSAVCVGVMAFALGSWFFLREPFEEK